ncbi:S4 domain-containing protein, partial [Streptosporangium algeriense]
DECAAVIAASAALFGQGSLEELPARTLGEALAEVPRAEISELGASYVDLLAQSGLVESKSAARRAVKEGGAYLNNVKVTDEAYVPSAEDLLHGRFLVLRRGKRSVGGVELLGA